MGFPALEELEGSIETKSKSLHAIFDEAGPDMDLGRVKSVKGDSRAIAGEIRKLNDELSDLGEQRDNLKAVEAAANRIRHAPDGGESGADTDTAPTAAPSTKSLGELFTSSRAYKGRQGPVGPEAHLDVELKTLMATTAGWDPEVTRTNRFIESAQRPVQVTDFIPPGTTSQAAVAYMEETTFTNAAAETAEGATYPEATLALTEKTSIVRKIPVYLPVTDEQLEDEPQVRGYINNRLPFMLRQRLDLQLLVGNGTPPNLRGILNVVGIQTQAKGTDPVPDAIYKAIVKVRVTGRAMPSAVIIHPNDWQDVRLLRTADGIYIWGNPSDAGPERIWGLPIGQSDAITENTALVGDFANFSELAMRRGIDIQVSNSHSTYFVEGKQAIRADLRCALVIYRPTAFATVTGI